MFGDNWFETTTDIITVITVVLQVYVIFLINKKSPTNMEEWVSFVSCLFTSFRYTFFLNMVVVSFEYPVSAITRLLQIYDLLFTASFGLGWGPGVTTHITGTVVHGLFQYLGLHFCLIMVCRFRYPLLRSNIFRPGLFSIWELLSLQHKTTL